MSTVEIRFDANAGQHAPQRVPQLLIDGQHVRTVGGFSLEIEVEQVEVPYSIDEPEVGKWRRFIPGVATYTVLAGGKAIMVAHLAPARVEREDGMTAHIWRDVEVTG